MEKRGKERTFSFLVSRLPKLNIHVISRNVPGVPYDHCEKIHPIRLCAHTLDSKCVSLQSSLFVDEIHYNFRTKTKDFMQIPHGLERGVYLSLITTRK